MSHSDPGSDTYRTRMIVRTNLEVPDILIAANEEFEENLKHVYTEVSDPGSKFYVGTDYLLFRFRFTFFLSNLKSYRVYNFKASRLYKQSNSTPVRP